MAKRLSKTGSNSSPLSLFKTSLEKQSGVIYSVKCKDYDSLYIRESGRKLESKLASSKSAIREHIERSKGHGNDWENAKLLERGQEIFQGKSWKPSISGLLNPKLNRDRGLELDPVWNNLLATKETRGPSGNSSLTLTTSMTSDEVVHHWTILHHCYNIR